ncbi:MAG: hypothetical protein Kow00107_02400 [Planctomycetota bacterium]
MSPEPKFAQSGLTLAEVLIALVILAIGLSGILAAFPVGQKMASEAEQNTISTIIASNNAAIIRAFRPSGEYNPDTDDPWQLGSMFLETDSDAPLAPVFSSFLTNAFGLDILPYNSDGDVLHDATTGMGNYEFSASVLTAERGTYKIYLMVIHRAGDEKLYNFLVGRGFDSWEVLP